MLEIVSILCATLVSEETSTSIIASVAEAPPEHTTALLRLMPAPTAKVGNTPAPVPNAALIPGQQSTHMKPRQLVPERTLHRSSISGLSGTDLYLNIVW